MSHNLSPELRDKLALFVTVERDEFDEAYQKSYLVYVLKSAVTLITEGDKKDTCYIYCKGRSKPLHVHDTPEEAWKRIIHRG